MTYLLLNFHSTEGLCLSQLFFHIIDLEKQGIVQGQEIGNILKCLNIGTPIKTLIFCFFTWKINCSSSTNILAQIRLQCAQILGHLRIINFPFEVKNGNLLLLHVLSVPILLFFLKIIILSAVKEGMNKRHT